METAKGCVMQLLNFGEAVAIGRRSSEKLFRILDMHDALADVLSDIELLLVMKMVNWCVVRQRGVRWPRRSSYWDICGV